MHTSAKLASVLALSGSLLAQTAVADPFPKRGVGYVDTINITVFGGSYNGNPSQINWQYNWGSDTNEKQPWAEYIPMLWSDSDAKTSVWASHVEKWLAKGSGHLLGFNEPDHPQQSNMTPQEAADAYRKWITPYKGRCALVSPAPTQGDRGMTWLKEFLPLCSDCDIKYVAAHFYGSNIDTFKTWVNNLCTIANGKLVWITEFSAYYSYDINVEKAFLQAAIPFLDNNSCVQKYAYFGSANSNQDLLSGSGLSDLGKMYAYTKYGASSL